MLQKVRPMINEFNATKNPLTAGVYDVLEGTVD